MKRKVGEYRRKKKPKKKEEEKETRKTQRSTAMTSGGEEKKVRERERNRKYIGHKVVRKCEAGEEEAPPLGQLAATV